MARDFDKLAKEFMALHVPGEPFILANAWDLGSAQMLMALGAKAIATTSAGYAFTLGRGDMGDVSRDEAISHARDLVMAVDAPVSGDLENGYGHDNESVAQTIRDACDAGLAGCCIEDTMLPVEAPYEFSRAVERIEAAVDAVKSLDREFVLTARADGILTKQYGTEEAIRRLKAFEAAGAQVLYAPMPPDMDELKRICASVEAPVNALCAGPFTKYTMAEFASAGVARVSLGSALARVTHKAIMDCAKAMFGSGDMSPLGNGVGAGVIDPLLEQGKITEKE
ncbi:MAG: isocitrate lyase/phosphoenolpyruvate mutase family protein [Rhizobiaceae bacterium]|nr:isocitrate lyase/phosphoenolpyruvate mutase family protein [Rhizobiaceae bacterium]